MMKTKEKKFVQLLTKYSVFMLFPVIVVGILVIFLYFGKLEKEFQQLNVKTIETANARMDMVFDELFAVYYQLSTNADVNAFLVKEFTNNAERVLVLKRIQQNIVTSLVNKDFIEGVALYSKINDSIICDCAALGRKEYYERYFAGSDLKYNEFNEIFEKKMRFPNGL